MKLRVNKDMCLGCGACCACSPNVFDFDNDGYPEVIVDEISEEDMQSAMAAKIGCPVGAIEEVTEEKEDN